MYNFFSDKGMKNSCELEDENELTRLTLWVGSQQRETHPSPPSSSATPPPSHPPSSSPPTLTPPPQTDISLSEPSSFNPNPNPNPNLMVSYFSDHNSNPQNAADDVNVIAPTDNTNPQNAADEVNVIAPTDNVPAPTPSTSSLRRQSRRAASRGSAQTKSEAVPEPFPWATNRRATVHSIKYLLQNNIHTVTGKVRCRRCEQEFQMSVDVQEKVTVLRKYIHRHRLTMHDRAPTAWSNPTLLECVHCGRENSAKPVINKKRETNWLFLLLTQTLGCCTLEHLKFFCKHTTNHRTGAKDRLLFLTYMTLWRQFEINF